jgi:hypothetical protein
MRKRLHREQSHSTCLSLTYLQPVCRMQSAGGRLSHSKCRRYKGFYNIPSPTDIQYVVSTKTMWVQSKFNFSDVFELQESRRHLKPYTAKAVPLHAMKALWGERYSSYSFPTSALDGGEWSAPRPGRALVPRKGPPVPTGQEAGWIPEPVWKQRVQEKSFRLCRGSNLDRPVVQPVTRLPGSPNRSFPLRIRSRRTPWNKPMLLFCMWDRVNL